MSVAVTINNSDRFQTALALASTKMKQALKQAQDDFGEMIRTQAYVRCPVRTGYLRSTIFKSNDGYTVRVGATAFYAGFVEFGTRFMFPRMFLRDSISYCAQAYQSLFESLIRQVFEGL